MAYLAPIHRPSGVRHALKLNFLSSDEESLIVAKSNRLEIYKPTVDGLILRHSKGLYGAVTMLAKLRPLNSNLDHLFVGTDRYMYFTLSWDSANEQLKTEKSYVDQTDKLARGSQSVERCMVDPTGKFLTLEVFEGTITVIPLFTKGKGKADQVTWALGDPIPSRIPERVIRSWGYLYSREMKKKPKNAGSTMAMLFEDNQQKCRLTLKTLHYAPGHNDDSANFVDEDAESKPEVDPSASHIIPVEPPTFGFLMLAETGITYWNEVTKKQQVQPLNEPTIWVAWAQVDSRRWLLADDYGKLYFLMAVCDRVDESVVTGLRLDFLGHISKASTMVYLDGGYVFVGSAAGDSQVVKVQEEGLEIIQTLTNIGPITDFTIMDMGSRSGEGQVNEFSSGQARIVTGSGAFENGSLRSVRSGVGLEDLGSLGDMSHVTNLFSLQSNPASLYADTLVVSFIDETRIFKFDGMGEVEEVENFCGFVFSEGTMLAQNVTQGKVLQVTPKIVRLVDLENDMILGEFSVSEGNSVVAASSNGQHLLLSIDGVQLVVLDMIEDLKKVSERNFEVNQQVSCVNLPSLVPEICIVGFWQKAEIALLKTSNLETIRTTTVDEASAAVPRSVLLTHLISGYLPTLLIALADGNVVTFDVEMPTVSLTNRKSTILGTQQANLKELPREDGLFQVFATCEHPSVIYGSEGRIIYSAVTAEQASCICPFNAEAYPGAMAIATPDNLRIGIVDTERTTHVQTLPIGETVRRIAYSPKLKAFALGCIKRKLRDGVEIIQSSVKLADEVVFKKLDAFQLNEEEIIESIMRTDLDEGGGKLVERFVVGTAYLEDETDESIRGRILVFEVTQDRLLSLVTQISVKGACRALSTVRGRIVAALMKTVVIYSFEYGSFNKVATFRTSTAPVDLQVSGDLIAVGDMMKSISILQFIPGEEGLSDKLQEIARHFQTAWATAIALVNEDTYLESDAEGNLTVLRRNVNGVTEDDKRRLEVTSEIRLGEMVNRIRSVNVPASANATVIPRAFMATAEGSLYLFGLIRPEKQDLLMRLQSKIATFVLSPGHVPFNGYRAFHNMVRDADEPFRFVDGELIERFLDCDAQMQADMVEGLGVDAEDVRMLVENLRRMH